MSREELIQQIVESLIKCQRLPSPAVWEALDLSRAQVGMLFMLHHHSHTNVNQVAQFLGVTKSAASQLLDPLVSKNLVSRRHDDKDRRIVRLDLTEDGSELIKQLNRHKYAGIRSALDSLSSQDLKVMAELHQKINHKINQKEI